MITPMKKATILCLAADREVAIQTLRDLGILHVLQTPASQSPADPATPSSQEAIQSRDQTLRVQRIFAEFAPKNAPKSTVSLPPHEAEALVQQALALDAQRESLEKSLQALRSEEECQAPLGNFNPDEARALAAKGITLSLYRLPLKVAALTPLPGTLLSTTATHQYSALLALSDDPAPTLPPEAESVPLPSRALSTLQQEARETEAALARIQSDLVALSPKAPALEPRLKSLDATIEFRKVSESLAPHGLVVSLDGFLPTARVPELEAAARVSGWALWLRDPEPDEKVPVSLTLPRWLRPIQVLFTGLGILPGYREVDVSSVFLVFFSFFFAMIVGDAGYGALLLLSLFALRRKFPKASSKPFWLFGVFAVATLFWGALTGSWFAIDAAVLPVWMRGVPWLKTDSNVMWLCFLVGAIHLSIANLWNAVVLWPSKKALAQVGWALINWTMFFVAGMLVAERAFPSIALVLGGIGLVLVVLFMLDKDEIKTEWINYPMLALNLVSALVDVMSYIRLFAVGMASAKIAMNFNEMALSMSMPIWIRPLPVLLILLFGHGLNIVLGALSVLVHAVRLNTLEFSNHIGLTWAGEPYRPFAHSETSKG